MKRILSFLCAAVLVLGLMLPAVSLAAAKTMTVTVAVQTYQNRARMLLKKINSYRKASGLQELTMTANLEKVALQRAVELFVLFDVVRPDMTDFDTAVADYASLEGATVAELIGCGESKAESMFDAWAANDDLLLDEEFTQIGIGCVYVKGSSNEYYWTVWLATPTEGIAAKAADKTGSAAGANRNVKVDVASSMFARADNSHKSFKLKAEDLKLGSKANATPAVYLVDQYDVKIGKIEAADLTYKADKSGVFTVTADGTVTRKKAGTGTLTVKFTNLDELALTVTCGNAAGATVKPTATPTKGSTATVSASEFRKIVPEISVKNNTKSSTLTINVKGADGYVLYRCDKKGGIYVKWDETTDTKWSVRVDTSSFERASYYFKVRAFFVNNGKRVYSEYSEPVLLKRP